MPGYEQWDYMLPFVIANDNNAVHNAAEYRTEEICYTTSKFEALLSQERGFAYLLEQHLGPFPCLQHTAIKPVAVGNASDVDSIAGLNIETVLCRY